MKANLVAISAVLVTVFSLAVFSADVQAPDNVFPLNEVKHGMIGYRFSDFGPDYSNKFSFRVISVTKSFNGYKHDIIWAILYDNPVLTKKDSGVFAGMSGSPCYSEDGRFLGTVSEGYGGSLEPMAGITPACDVLAVNDKNFLAESKDPSNNSIAHLNDYNFQCGASNSLMIVSAGRMYSENYENLNKLLASKPLVLSVGRSDFEANPFGNLKLADKNLNPGDSVGVGLVVGDVTISGTGTVSYVSGKDVWIFGHPMFQMGKVNFAMLAAETQGIFIVQPRSWKNTNTGEVIGTFTQDRFGAVYGHLGQMPEMIPVKVDREINGKKETLNFYIVKQSGLTPLLMVLSVKNLLTDFSDNQKVGVSIKVLVCVNNGEIKTLSLIGSDTGMVTEVLKFFNSEFTKMISAGYTSSGEKSKWQSFSKRDKQDKKDKDKKDVASEPLVIGEIYINLSLHDQ